MIILAAALLACLIIFLQRRKKYDDDLVLQNSFELNNENCGSAEAVFSAADFMRFGAGKDDTSAVLDRVLSRKMASDDYLVNTHHHHSDSTSTRSAKVDRHEDVYERLL